MDWSRAKTIFIISFILLDLFLAAQISQMIEQKSNYLRTDEITDEQIRELLEAKQIRITTPIADRTTKIPALQATITPVFNWDHDEKWIYQYSFHPQIPIKNQTALQKYLKEKLPFFHEYTYSKEYSNNNKHVFLQQHEQYPIFDGKIVCNLENGAMTNIQVLHFQIKKQVNVDFISFNHALFNFITRENLPKKAKITNVVLGYRSMYYPSPNDVILLPVWRFTVNHQQHYYIYATTNNLNDHTAWQQINKKES